MDDKQEHDPGAVPATGASVRAYLVKEFGLAPDQALALVEKHAMRVREVQRAGSFAYAAGDQIAEAEGLVRP